MVFTLPADIDQRPVVINGARNDPGSWPYFSCLLFIELPRR